MGKVENIFDLRLLILLLTVLTLLLYFCCKVGKKKKRIHSDNTGKQHQLMELNIKLFNKTYVSHVSFLDLFCTTKSRWPQLAAALGQGGIAPPRLRNPQLRTKKSTSVTACPTNRQSCFLVYNNKK